MAEKRSPRELNAFAGKDDYISEENKMVPKPSQEDTLNIALKHVTEAYNLISDLRLELKSENMELLPALSVARDILKHLAGKQ